MDVEFQSVATNGIKLHAAVAGPADGPVVILLHGFPEFWFGWRNQIPALVAAGYRVIAPDQRGYNLSDKPPAVRDYRMNQLADDVLGLIDWTGADKVRLVGHDWGAAVAWFVAGQHADRIDRLAIINVAHPAVMRRFVFSKLKQLRRSWYMFFFQIPWLPEWYAGWSRFDGLAAALKKNARPGAFRDEDLERYRTAWSQPDSFRSMIHWYRAAMRHRIQPRDWRITVPTLLIWGAQDAFIDPRVVEPSLANCDDGRLHMIEEATHWVTHEEPEQVNHALLDFLAEPPS